MYSYRSISWFKFCNVKRDISGPSSWKQKRSHYAILEIGPTSTSKEIKDAFINLSKQLHPDLHPEGQSKSDTERFQMVIEAYDVLSDPIRKKEYDASLGLTRKQPFSRSKVKNTSHEYDEAGNCNFANIQGLSYIRPGAENMGNLLYLL